MTAFDVVVVGGGSAGCVVAAELAADPSLSVLVLEAGGRPEDHPATLSASGYKDAFVDDAVMGSRHTVPQPALGGRRVFAGTGRGLGGSGSVNGMVYTRGARQDYDAWPDGWQWDDVVPAFEAVEARLRPAPRPPTQWTEAAIAAAEATGFRRGVDLNDGDLSGVFGYQPMNHDGVHRRSSYVAFLRERIGQAPNLTVVTGARTERLRFADGRIAAVRYVADGQVHEVTVRREVVLCAGALETPRLLQLSGIGPAASLRALGLDVVRDAPEVGANLHDHPNVIVLFRGTGKPVDCALPQLYGFHRARADAALAPGQPDTCTVMYPARSSFQQASERMAPSMVLPGALLDAPWAIRAVRAMVRLAMRLPPVRRWVDGLWGVVVILGKPRSRGTVRLVSADPTVPAAIDPAYLSAPEDVATLRAGLERAWSLAHAAPLRPWLRGALLPWSHRRLTAHLRQQLITTFHFAGTCRMGDDAAAPVDGRLRLRGVQGVRVADASVMPETPVAALNAPSMMIGYRAASFLREELASASAAASSAKV
ncbi:MAG: GMC family oxidoreductase [Alphaproteobacteria bacterium]|nr:GMC family oxidoreductase [Alphaproteobacteria bacterium]